MIFLSLFLHIWDAPLLKPALTPLPVNQKVFPKERSLLRQGAGGKKVVLMGVKLDNFFFGVPLP